MTSWSLITLKDILVIEKYDPDKIWSLVLFDADQQYYYLNAFSWKRPKSRKIY